MSVNLCSILPPITIRDEVIHEHAEEEVAIDGTVLTYYGIRVHFSRSLDSDSMPESDDFGIWVQAWGVFREMNIDCEDCEAALMDKVLANFEAEQNEGAV